MADLPSAVFDTGVILQAALNPRGPAAATFAAMEQGKVEVYLSPRLRAEVEAILNYPEVRRKHPHLTDALAQAILHRLDEKTLLLHYTSRHIEYPRDPNDEPSLNLAIEVKANYLASRDQDML